MLVRLVGGEQWQQASGPWRDLDPERIFAASKTLAAPLLESLAAIYTARATRARARDESKHGRVHGARGGHMPQRSERATRAARARACPRGVLPKVYFRPSRRFRADVGCRLKYGVINSGCHGPNEDT